MLALFFLASAAHAQPASHEQILVPFDTAVMPGQHGAMWVAELWVRNDADSPVNLFPERCFFIGREVPCGRRIDVEPGGTRLLDVLAHVSPQEPGVFLYVPTTHAGRVQFSLRVREGNDPVGTDVRVVRRNEYRSGMTTFIGVPLGEALRPTLRVYYPDLQPQSTFVVRVYREPEGELVTAREYTVVLPTDPPSPPLVPATADFSETVALAAMVGARRVTVTVERTFPAELPYWPLLSVTSNDTNRVTVFHPN